VAPPLYDLNQVGAIGGGVARDPFGLRQLDQPILHLGRAHLGQVERKNFGAQQIGVIQHAALIIRHGGDQTDPQQAFDRTELSDKGVFKQVAGNHTTVGHWGVSPDVISFIFEQYNKLHTQCKHSSA
jgi:hypothetical protein